MKTSLFLLLGKLLLIGAGCASTPAREPAIVPADQPEIAIVPSAEVETEAIIIPEEDVVPPPSFTKVDNSADLVGSWEVVEGDVEEIILDADGTYSTFLHERPFDDGEWGLLAGHLILESSGLDVKIFKDVVFEEGMFILEGNDGLREVWSPLDSNQ